MHLFINQSFSPSPDEQVTPHLPPARPRARCLRASEPARSLCCCWTVLLTVLARMGSWRVVRAVLRCTMPARLPCPLTRSATHARVLLQLGDLYKCFQTDGKLVIHYALMEAWG